MKNYSVRFGTGDPRTFSGLSPTLLLFFNLSSGATILGPTFTEGLTGTGIYTFQWGTTTPIAFLADAATTSPGSGRYVTGQLDPEDRSDEYGNTLTALGNSNVALSTSLLAIGNTIMSNVGSNASFSVILGTTASSIGGLSALPVDIFGYAMRLEQLFSGQQQFTKSSGQLTLFDRTGATTLVQRTITNNASLVTKV